MAESSSVRVVDTLTLRFTGEDEDGAKLHELRAAHVAEVLQGIAALSSDFDQAGVFTTDGSAGSEVLVRPAQEGSFLLEIVRVVHEVAHDIAPIVKAAAPAVAAGSATGIPSLSAIVWWSTKSMRATVKEFSYLENGNVKVVWSDDTAEEIPAAAWVELNKRKRRRKKQLRQIMAPLADRNVTALNVSEAPAIETGNRAGDEAPEVHVLERADYDAAKPEDDTEEDQDTFETEAQLSVIDFENSGKWKVKTKEGTRSAKVEDTVFLERVSKGLAIRKSDIFRLRIREDAVKKNGRTKTTWTVLHVESHRRASGDNDS